MIQMLTKVNNVLSEKELILTDKSTQKELRWMLRNVSSLVIE